MDKAHVKRLLTDVTGWNKWRVENPKALPNLREANLRGANLRGADLCEADLCLATFCGATIDGAVVGESDIGGPGHILCALTDDEWEMIKGGREESDGDRS